MTDFSRLLNPEQCAAATAGDGPLLVLAAAGTGKTRTLVHRVAYLVERGVPAGRILLLTFTNRAAREMLDRATALCGDGVASIWSGTFHSVCARFLRRYGSSLGYRPGFQILDEEDSRRLVGEIIKASVADPKSFPKKEIVAKIISEAANERKSVLAIASRWQTKTAGIDPEEIEAIAVKYNARKMELGAMDFDDLLANGLRMLKENDGVRDALQGHFLHVLVDEYQDTNGIQAEFADLLAARNGNIMAVGDDFQCIYTWRGAQIDNIMEFPSRWKDCRIVKLERNYRSVPQILNVANAVMKDSPRQFEKTLRPARAEQGGLPAFGRVFDADAQAAEIVREIGLLRDSGRDLGEIAVLYRSHFHSVNIQTALARARIPFRITSGVGFFEQMHVKDALSCLRVVTDSADELSFVRLLRLLPGVGERGAMKAWEKLGRRFDPASADDRAAAASLLPAKARPAWNLVSKCFEAACDHIGENAPGEIVEDFCDLFYEDYLRREFGDEEAEERLDDLKELAVQVSAAPSGLADFLSDVALLTNLDTRRGDPASGQVVLSTVHQAKGMEWPIVFVPWLSEGMFPSAKAQEEGRMDEERRLFYVAVTRARDMLYLYSPQMRKTPDGGMFPVKKSVFAEDIPEDLLDIRQETYTQSYRDFDGYPRRDRGSWRRW